MTGVLHVTGNPGGLFHLREGVVVTVDSPGAPGAEALLRRSGRISEGDWTAALRLSAEDGSPWADLVARGCIGSAGLQAIAMMVAQDSTFAVAVGGVDDCVVDDDIPASELLPVAGGVDPRDLLREAARRLDGLGSLPFDLSPYRERVVHAAGFDPSATALTADRRDILEHASGRRSARDIAFLVGRGVYPVTVEISRMLAEGILEIAPSAEPVTSSKRIGSLRPRHEAVTVADHGDPGLSETERKHIGL